MKTNLITIDLRQLTNEQLLGLHSLNILDINSELASRGYNGMPHLLYVLGSQSYGTHKTLEQYLNSLPEPQYKDTRNEGGC